MTGSLADGSWDLGELGASTEARGTDDGLETILLPVGLPSEDRIRSITDAAA